MRLLPITLQFKEGSIESELQEQQEIFLDVHNLAVQEKTKLEQKIRKMIDDSP